MYMMIHVNKCFSSIQGVHMFHAVFHQIYLYSYFMLCLFSENVGQNIKHITI